MNNILTVYDDALYCVNILLIQLVHPHIIINVFISNFFLIVLLNHLSTFYFHNHFFYSLLKHQYEYKLTQHEHFNTIIKKIRVQTERLKTKMI